MKKIKALKVDSWDKGSRVSDNLRNDRIAKIMNGNANVKVIPATKEERALKGIKLRVAAYCRVSTDTYL